MIALARRPQIPGPVATFAPAVLVVVVQLVAYPIPIGVWLQGAVLGLLNALVVVGLLLVYRANRVINLAQSSFGTLPSAIGIGLVLFGAPGVAAVAGLGLAAGLIAAVAAVVLWRADLARALLAAVATALVVAAIVALGAELGYFGGLLVGLVAAVLLGLAVDVVVVHRLRRASRLVLTVATIGIAQLFAVGALLTPRLWDRIQLTDRDADFNVPGDLRFDIGSTVFRGDEILAAVVAIVVLALVAFALAKTDAGIAVRAAADRNDRASMLGVPVPRLEAGVWVVAAVLGFLGTFLQAGILGLEISAGVGLRVLVAALAALAIVGFGSIPAAVAAAVAIGVLAHASGPAGGNTLTTTDTVLAVVVLVGLLVRRGMASRTDRGEVSSWQATVDPTPLPRPLARERPLRIARWVGGIVLFVVALGLPLVLSPSQEFRAATVAALAVLALSVVVLTGWTGQVTLGQMAFAAVGAAVAAVATYDWHWDVTLTLLVAGAAGAVVAIIVGVPSLRWQGIFLAVTTLAFALAAMGSFLNPSRADWIPTEPVYRRPLLGAWDLREDAAMYRFTLVVLVLCLIAVAGIRRARPGRAMRAIRDNGPGAQAYGVRLPLARLMAFGLSGFLAGVAGGLMLYINEGYDVATFSAEQGINVFISAVVGGVGSSLGAVLGAGVLDGSRNFLSGDWSLLPSAAGVLVVLLVLPGGLAQLVERIRDTALRAYSRRRGLDVPGLLAAAPGAPGPADATGAAGTAGVPGSNGSRVPWAAPRRSDGADRDGDAPRGLSVRGLDVAYDRVQVLFGVDVDFVPGRITALLGTNGAGKSTLLRAIGGVAPVTGGSIHLGGTDLGALRPEQVAAEGIAQMPGGAGVFPSLTVDENLRVAGWLFRRDREEVARRVAEVRGRFPVLEDRAGDAAGDLSGGQQQQLALAMALLAEPRLLLVDELSLGLAPVLVEGLLQELRTLRDRGTTIVVVEQSVNVALTVADHAYFMEKGEIRFSGPAHELLDQPDLLRSVFLQGARDALGAHPAGTVTDASGERPRLVGKPQGGGERIPFDAAPSALEARSLSVAFGGIAAVDEVDLSVAPSEIVGIIGPNGAGKTTLFDLISGFTAATSGVVRLFGAEVSHRSPSARARAGLGRSFQNARLFGGLTVSETIAVALERYIDAGDPVSAALRLPAAQTTEAAVAARVDELIELFGLEAFRDRRVGELSTGSRRMVDLACVIAHQPDVVLLDEPTSGIAQREAEALGPLLLGLRDRLGAALIVVEHDIALVSSIADRLVALDQGAVVASGPPADVLDHPQVVESYLGSGSDSLQRSGTRTDQRSGGSR